MVDSPAASEQDVAARVTGTIKWFDESKGYGFVVRDDSRDDIFCHINQVAEECDFPKRVTEFLSLRALAVMGGHSPGA